MYAIKTDPSTLRVTSVEYTLRTEGSDIVEEIPFGLGDYLLDYIFSNGAFKYDPIAKPQVTKTQKNIMDRLKAQVTYTAMETDTLIQAVQPTKLDENNSNDLGALKKDIIYWYVHGLWTETMLQKAATKNIFTQEEINKIIIDNQ